ncbi:hypothetical protein AVDCRST_MAG94-1411, partial [uncultured Leptolyngbya sp.]
GLRHLAARRLSRTDPGSPRAARRRSMGARALAGSVRLAREQLYWRFHPCPTL